MTIKVIKLVTGEEVIGDMKPSGPHDDRITVDKPCAVMLVSSKSTPDQHSMALIPYAAYTADHSIEIYKKSIVWTAELADDVLNQYNSIFGSGIQIVTGNLPSSK
jgi:hypothetical protein